MFSPEEIVGAQMRLLELKKKLETQTRIDKLVQDKEFKELIIDGFCRDNSASLVHQAFDPAADAQVRADALQMASAGGHLLRWLAVGEMQRDMIQREIDDVEQMLNEIVVDNVE